MHIISSSTLRSFFAKYADSKYSLIAWLKIAKTANWHNFVEVRQSFPSADLVGNLTVFNIGGNKYRLITYINYKTKKIFIREFLTHSEYDKNNWKSDPWF